MSTQSVHTPLSPTFPLSPLPVYSPPPSMQAESYISMATMAASALVTISIAEMDSRSTSYYATLSDHLAYYLDTTAASQLQRQLLAPSRQERLSVMALEPFFGLVMDAVDEFDRRSTNNPNVPFLLILPGLSSTRNQARQKLAKMTLSTFQKLATDLLLELGHRFPKAVQSYRFQKALPHSLSKSSPDTLAIPRPAFGALSPRLRTVDIIDDMNRMPKEQHPPTRYSIFPPRPEGVDRDRSPSGLSPILTHQRPSALTSPSSPAGKHFEYHIATRSGPTVNVPPRKAPGHYHQQMPSPIPSSASESIPDINLDVFLDEMGARLRSEFIDDSSLSKSRARRSKSVGLSRSNSQRSAYRRPSHNDDFSRQDDIIDSDTSINGGVYSQSPSTPITIPAKSTRRGSDGGTSAVIRTAGPEAHLSSLQVHIAELLVAVRASLIPSMFSPLRSILILCKTITSDAESYRGVSLPQEIHKRLETTTINLATCSKVLMQIAKQYTNTSTAPRSQQLFEYASNNLTVAFRATVSAIRAALTGSDALISRSHSREPVRADSAASHNVGVGNELALPTPVLSTSSPRPSFSTLQRSPPNPYLNDRQEESNDTTSSRGRPTHLGVLTTTPIAINRHQLKSARLSVEEVTDRIARSIQDLLTRMRDSEISSDTLYEVMLIVISHINHLVAQTEHIGRLVAPLAYSMSSFRIALIGNCMSLRSLGDKIRFAPHNREVKQQIANTVYDIAKQAKMLLQELQ
ncbi:hypothetical protein BASA50_004987 [Batrachochytrium salamandrivorans]|uniref:GIT Spa2 homology (SHD) domain-containing protein n=1 Tax=Batrachochytrium salamandrivorans TaxID=1357716 RepID=A0ABQ8FE19_9FUNG|nr:hypothetical protein BASA50_004987 [Batrachochytrium salamandrivorans]